MEIKPQCQAMALISRKPGPNGDRTIYGVFIDADAINNYLQSHNWSIPEGSKFIDVAVFNMAALDLITDKLGRIADEVKDLEAQRTLLVSERDEARGKVDPLRRLLQRILHDFETEMPPSLARDVRDNAYPEA